MLTVQIWCKSLCYSVTDRRMAKCYVIFIITCEGVSTMYFAETAVAVIHPPKRTGGFPFAWTHTSRKKKWIGLNRWIFMLSYGAGNEITFWMSGCRWCWTQQDHQWCSRNKKLCPNRPSRTRIHQLQHGGGRKWSLPCTLWLWFLLTIAKPKSLKTYLIDLFKERMIKGWNKYSGPSLKQTYVVLLDCATPKNNP